MKIDFISFFLAVVLCLGGFLCLLDSAPRVCDSICCNISHAFQSKGARNLTPLCRAVDDDDDDVGGGGGMQLLDVSVWFLFFFCCSVLSFPNYLNGGNLLVP